RESGGVFVVDRSQMPIVRCESDAAADARAHLVELVDRRAAEVDASPKRQQVEIDLHVGEFLRERWPRFIERQVAALDLLNDVGGFAQLTQHGIRPGRKL